MNYDMVEHENRWEGPANIISGMLIQAVIWDLENKINWIDDWIESYLGKHHSLCDFLSESLQYWTHYEYIFHNKSSLSNRLCYFHAVRSLLANKMASKTLDWHRYIGIRSTCDYKI